MYRMEVGQRGRPHPFEVLMERKQPEQPKEKAT